MESKEVLAFAKAAMILGSDWPKDTMDAIFFHALSQDAVGEGRGNLFELVARLYSTGFAKAVVINGSNGERYGRNIPGESWAGKDEWAAKLKGLGVQNVFLASPAFNTKEENNAFLALAQEQKWKRAGLVTVAYHFPRTMMGFVKSMKDLGYYLTAHAVASKSLKWFSSMHGSQGKQLSTAFDLIDEETARIPRYTAQGDLCTFEELFLYLREREKYSSKLE